MFRRLLVLVPHQDDELNIAGQVLPSFIEVGCECKICFSTNGDGFRSNGPVRLKEAMEVADCLGVGRKNLIFLGFTDCMDSDHPYNRASGREVDAAPLTMTYSADVPCYSKFRCGEAQPQCKKTLVADIESLIRAFLPDVVICIDYDSHPDHRALSLAFETAMGNILRSQTNYRPLVLKKFAYPSVWYGPVDYSTFAFTQKPKPGDLFELDNPMYSWDERICVAPHPSTLTRSFFKNLMFEAARSYRSQNAWWFMRSVCNSDVVYWCRRTDNLVFEAAIKTSSGDPACFKDFLLFDVADVCSDDLLTFSGYGFKFDDADDLRTIELVFSEPVDISEVIVRESPCSFGFLSDVELSFDYGEALSVPRAKHFSGGFSFSAESPLKACEVLLTFRGSSFMRITSIEVYPSHIGDYAPLKTFRTLTGICQTRKPSRFSFGLILKLVAKITGKVAYIGTMWRERRFCR